MRSSCLPPRRSALRGESPPKTRRSPPNYCSFPIRPFSVSATRSPRWKKRCSSPRAGAIPIPGHGGAAVLLVLARQMPNFFNRPVVRKFFHSGRISEPAHCPRSVPKISTWPSRLFAPACCMIWAKSFSSDGLAVGIWRRPEGSDGNAHPVGGHGTKAFSSHARGSRRLFAGAVGDCPFH